MGLLGAMRRKHASVCSAQRTAPPGLTPPLPRPPCQVILPRPTPPPPPLQAVWWCVLRWTDPAAAGIIANSTAVVQEGLSSCDRPCDSSGLMVSGCCDGLWLPHLHLTNMIALPQV